MGGGGSSGDNLREPGRRGSGRAAGDAKAGRVVVAVTAQIG